VACVTRHFFGERPADNYEALQRQTRNVLCSNQLVDVIFEIAYRTGHLGVTCFCSAKSSGDAGETEAMA